MWHWKTINHELIVNAGMAHKSSSRIFMAFSSETIQKYSTA
jgi:hypothetical protein